MLSGLSRHQKLDVFMHTHDLDLDGDVDILLERARRAKGCPSSRLSTSWTKQNGDTGVCVRSRFPSSSQHRRDGFVRLQPISGTGGRDDYGRGEKVSDPKIPKMKDIGD
jgi:hypothetical protein